MIIEISSVTSGVLDYIEWDRNVELLSISSVCGRFVTVHSFL